MPIIDAQVHAYERDRPERPWAAVLAGPAEVTTSTQRVPFVIISFPVDSIPVTPASEVASITIMDAATPQTAEVASSKVVCGASRGLRSS